MTEGQFIDFVESNLIPGIESNRLASNLTDIVIRTSTACLANIESVLVVIVTFVRFMLSMYLIPRRHLALHVLESYTVSSPEIDRIADPDSQ